MLDKLHPGTGFSLLFDTPDIESTNWNNGVTHLSSNCGSGLKSLDGKGYGHLLDIACDIMDNPLYNSSSVVPFLLYPCYTRMAHIIYTEFLAYLHSSSLTCGPKVRYRQVFQILVASFASLFSDL